MLDQEPMSSPLVKASPRGAKITRASNGTTAKRNAKLAAVTADIRKALAEGDILGARQLSVDGLTQFPDDVWMQNIHKALAPPRIIDTHVPARPSSGENQVWLKKNWPDHRGKWIALRDGEFLGADESLEELRKKITLSPDVFITKIA